MIFFSTILENVAELFTHEQQFFVKTKKSTASIFLLTQLSDRFTVPFGPSFEVVQSLFPVFFVQFLLSCFKLPAFFHQLLFGLKLSSTRLIVQYFP